MKVKIFEEETDVLEAIAVTVLIILWFFVTIGISTMTWEFFSVREWTVWQLRGAVALLSFFWLMFACIVVMTLLYLLNKEGITIWDLPLRKN